MTPQELRNSILQLAIQGKLVEQRPEEGTAEGLYQQIQAAKKRLIKAGNNKKEKPLPEITEDEKPFVIPESWKWQSLGNCCEMYTGNSISENEKKVKYSGLAEGYDYVATRNISFNQEIQYDNGVRIPFDSTFKRAYRNSVLMCIEGGSAGRKIGILDRDVCFGNKLCMFRTNMVLNTFLFYFLQSNQFKKLFSEKMTGIIGGVSIRSLKEILIPLPPLAEQRRIVAKIEELMPYIKCFEKAWNKLENFNKRFPTDLQKSILQMAIQGKLVEQRPQEEGTGEELYRQIQIKKQKLTKVGAKKMEKTQTVTTEGEFPFDIPESWKWVSIGSTCINIQYGTSQKSSQKGKVAVLRMGNVQSGKIKYDSLVYSSNESDIEKYSLNCGDLLFNRTNSKELVGKTAIYKGDMPAIYAGYLIRITPVLLDSDYLNYVMQSQYHWIYCQTVRSDAIGQSNINAEKLKRFLFPLPPLVEQKRIVARLEEILPLCEKLKQLNQA